MGLGAPPGEQGLSPHATRTEDRDSPPEERRLGLPDCPRLGRGDEAKFTCLVDGRAHTRATGRGGKAQVGGRAGGFS